MDENKKPDTISYFAHEAEMARSENHAKRMFIAFIVSFVTLVLTNAGWILYESQYQDVVTVTQDAQTEGSPIYQNGTGSMTLDGKGTADNH